MRRLLMVLIFMLSGWLFFAQVFMKMRESDNEAKIAFAQSGVELTTDTIISDGFTLHYAQTGNDTLPTLFFIHGSPGSWNAFEVYMKDSTLLAQYHMISIDRPGFGYSQFGDAKNLEEQVEIINPLLNRIANGKSIYIVSHSLGGPLSVKLTAENNEHISGLVILAGSVSNEYEPTESWRAVMKTFPLKYLLPGAFRPSNKEIWMVKSELKPLSDQFKLITCPVWIIHGDADTFVPVENAYYARKMLVNSSKVELKIIKGASHFIPWKPFYEKIKEVLIRLSEDN